MLRKVLALSIVTGFVALVISVGSALFTDSASVTGNTFTTGTVDISTSPTSALVTFSNMAPGDQVIAPITVTNGGSLRLRYAVTSVATNADSKGLMSELDLTIKSAVTACTNAGFAADGTTVYAAADLGSVAGINVIGDPATGAQAGDRELAASGSEVLCFKVNLPSATGNAYQNATTTATFTFSAEQTANN
jgi:spore coat-associated protein N